MKTTTLVVLLTVFLSGCAGKESAEERLARRNARIAEQVKELAGRYNAVTNIADLAYPGNAQRSSWRVLTLELQEAVLTTNARPILLEGWIEDVSKQKDGKIVLETDYLSCSLHFPGLMKSRMVLEPSMVDRIRQMRAEYRDKIVAVVRPESLEKINGNDREYVLTGTCLELVFPGESTEEQGAPKSEIMKPPDRSNARSTNVR